MRGYRQCAHWTFAMLLVDAECLRYCLEKLRTVIILFQLLLRNLVNKLGDPSQKVASKAIYSLIQLLQVHPNMKFVVMEETEKLLFR
jgi:hypothetical protein